MYFRIALFALLLAALPLSGFAQKSPSNTAPGESQFGTRPNPGESRGIRPNPGAESYGFWWMDRDMRVDHSLKVLQRDLSLTDSQVSRIRDLAESRKTRFASIHEQMMPKFEHLMTLLRQPNPDPSAVGRATIELNQVHDQARAQQAALEKDFYSILTESQRTTVDKLRSQASAVLALRRLGFLAPEWMGNEQASLFNK
jgi:Spy/CpxP family protein refolding chaperone